MEVDEIQTPQPARKFSRVNSNTRIDSSKIGGGPTTSALEGQWQQHSSRIIRVSRASGGKDRHSKVLTAKGPRDRRVRLSVTTAIQFYDLQDRLGFDQPSKAVEWLIKAAADSINELPSLDTARFPPETTPLNKKKVDDTVDSVSANAGLEGLMSKSGSSSNNSETSKGSGLSLSRGIKQTRNNCNNNNNHNNNDNNSNNPWWSSASATPMEDCFGTGLISSFGVGNSENHHHHQHNNQHFPLLPDQHLIQAGNMASGISSLNSTISSFNRGTLQSNSPSFLPYLQRFSATDGSINLPFFLGGAPVSSSAPTVGNHHHQHQKGKGKN